ncbi:ADP-ribosylation factor-like [Silene latifolia]|uniref:ADP-ribosylation factor-like n=1 Tax=Silene latifolia TaxID=37657 RepID=UPI003D7891CC
MGVVSSNLTTMIYGKKKLQMLMIGRGFAGKSTILHQLIHGEFIPINTATVGIDPEDLDYKDVSFVIFEIGGQLRDMQLLLKHCFNTTPALIMVVDSSDRDRIEDAREELHRYMKEIEVIGKKANILVYANKQDLPNAMSVAEITDKLDLQLLDRHYWHVQASSCVTGEGLHDGLDWLYRQLTTKD